MIKKAAIIIFVSLLSCGLAVAQEGAGTEDATGADSIFEEIGMDKPTKWSEWERETKFDYLQNLGISPSEGKKYKGTTGDLTLYFEKLELEQPENWATMSFEEKKEYITTPIEPAEVKEESSLPSEAIDIALIAGFIVLLIVGIRLRKVVDPIVYYVFPIGLIVYSMFFPTNSFFNYTGTISKVLLIFLLFIKPIAKILHSKLLMQVCGYRRQLGLITFWFFIIHTAGLVYLFNLFSISDYLTAKHIIGVLAGIALLILAITSNYFSIRILKNHWKTLQYLVYPTLFGVLFHTSINEHGNLSEFYIVCGAFVVLKLLEWKGAKKDNPS